MLLLMLPEVMDAVRVRNSVASTSKLIWTDSLILLTTAVFGATGLGVTCRAASHLLNQFREPPSSECGGSCTHQGTVTELIQPLTSRPAHLIITYYMSSLVMKLTKVCLVFSRLPRGLLGDDNVIIRTKSFRASTKVYTGIGATLQRSSTRIICYNQQSYHKSIKPKDSTERKKNVWHSLSGRRPLTRSKKVWCLLCFYNTTQKVAFV